MCFELQTWVGGKFYRLWLGIGRHFTLFCCSNFIMAFYSNCFPCSIAFVVTFLRTITMYPSFSCIEVKCPYSGRNENVLPGKQFPFLHRNSHGEVSLKQTSNYYSQIQGQLFIAKRKYCYCIVHTSVDS
jgi:hypothetical protein